MKKITAIYMMMALAMFIFIACDGDDDPVKPTVTKNIELIDAQTDISGTTGDNLYATARFHNKGTEAITLKMEMTVVEITEGHSLEVCWSDQCYADKEGDFAPPVTLTIEPGDTSMTLNCKVELAANDIAGTTKVKLLVYDENNTEDKQEINITFEVTAPSIELVSYDSEVGPLSLESHAVLKNVSSEAIDIKIILYLDNLLDGHNLEFCWGSCYAIEADSDTFETPNGVSLESGETSGEQFHMTLSSGSTSGTSVVKYRAYVVGREYDYVEFSTSYIAQ